jgi:ankyrin repeat protein
MAATQPQIGEQLSRSRSRSSDHNERLEPQLLRAVEIDDVPRLEKILDAAKTKGQLNENFLRIGLMRSSEKGKVNATRFLLDHGALPDGGSGGGNRLSPLLRAVERNHIPIVHMLLEAGASPETSDKKGRTALMTAAWKNHWHILNSLISKGADVNAKDERGRNVLHNLAADKQCDWGDSVIELLLKTNIAIDGEQGQDKLGRTPLHWACATGKLHLAELLLERARPPRARLEAVEIRGKTSLHLAAAHDWDYIVDMLLLRGADVHAVSDGAWTPLHNACEVGSVKIVSVVRIVQCLSLSDKYLKSRALGSYLCSEKFGVQLRRHLSKAHANRIIAHSRRLRCQRKTPQRHDAFTSRCTRRSC